MAQVLMLDVDGVLVTRMRAGAFSWSDGLEEDLGVAKEALMEHFFVPHWGAIVTGKEPMMPRLRQAMQVICPELSAEVVRDYWFAQDSRVMAKVLSDVDELRGGGMHVWLATNQEHNRAAYLMGDMGLAGHVDGMIYSANVGAKKPDAAFFAAAERAVGGAEYVLVDDTRANVHAARAVGWKGHHWQEGDRLLEVLAP